MCVYIKKRNMYPISIQKSRKILVIHLLSHPNLQFLVPSILEDNITVIMMFLSHPNLQSLVPSILEDPNLQSLVASILEDNITIIMMFNKL